ncbi:hypothetical protein SDC9_104643 [bioreactor metagenome]|uniref:N-acetyltransferase domain-containing protein n=1 Tax=bioreactor metagenome TaxID=1076179 RepID=A0A645AXC4_9ZZZZ
MMKIKTRNCKLDDYDFVISLVRETIFPLVSNYYQVDENIYKERFETDFKEREILEINQKPIGFYQVKQNDDELEIKGLFLIKEYRNKGIGKYLMEKFEKTNGIKSLVLKVWDNNKAVEFYKKLGYKIIEEKDHKFLMKKIIS